MSLWNSLYHHGLRRLLGDLSLHHRGASDMEKLRLCDSPSNEDSSSVSSPSDEHVDTSSSWAYSGDVAREGIGVADAVEHSDGVDWFAATGYSRLLDGGRFARCELSSVDEDEDDA